MILGVSGHVRGQHVRAQQQHDSKPPQNWWIHRITLKQFCHHENTIRHANLSKSGCTVFQVVTNISDDTAPISSVHYAQRRGVRLQLNTLHLVSLLNPPVGPSISCPEQEHCPWPGKPAKPLVPGPPPSALGPSVNYIYFHVFSLFFSSITSHKSTSSSYQNTFPALASAIHYKNQRAYTTICDKRRILNGWKLYLKNNVML